MFRKLLLIFFLIFGFSFVPFSVAHAAVTWSETQPAGDQNRAWSTGSMSSDGHKMIIGNQDGGLFISSTSGSSWSQISPSGNDFDVWYVSAMSANGEVILAGVYGGYLYLSRDGGSSWTEVQPAGHSSILWMNTSMSSDGQVILVSSDGGRLYRTVDGGSTWSELRPLGDLDLTWHTAVSNDGRIMFASEDTGTGGRIYISRDTGSTWTETQPLDNGVHGWTSVGMSPDGMIMLATMGADRVYISRNGGSSWTVSGDIVGQWFGSSISEGGSDMLISGTQRLYFSHDTGNTLTETQPAGDVDKNWQIISISGNSQVLLAGSYDGRIYIGSNPSVPVLENTVSRQCAQTPTSPDLFQISTAKTTATISFTPVRYASNYIVSYGFTSDANQFSVVTGQGSSTGVLSYTINALPSGSTLFFKVYGQNDCAQGSWSNTMKATTNAKVYYKNLLSQVLSVLPKKTTTLGAKTTSGPVACSTYTVQSGDSLWSIAASKLGSGTFFSQIQKTNNLPTSLIHTGQSLKLGC